MASVDELFTGDGEYGGGRAKRKKKRSESRSARQIDAIATGDADAAWQQFTAEDGRTYYYNQVTRESRWKLPKALRQKKASERDAGRDCGPKDNGVTKEQKKHSQKHQQPSEDTAPAERASKGDRIVRLQASLAGRINVMSASGPPPMIHIPRDTGSYASRSEPRVQFHEASSAGGSENMETQYEAETAGMTSAERLRFLRRKRQETMLKRDSIVEQDDFMKEFATNMKKKEAERAKRLTPEEREREQAAQERDQKRKEEELNMKKKREAEARKREEERQEEQRRVEEERKQEEEQRREEEERRRQLEEEGREEERERLEYEQNRRRKLEEEEPQKKDHEETEKRRMSEEERQHQEVKPLELRRREIENEDKNQHREDHDQAETTRRKAGKDKLQSKHDTYSDDGAGNAEEESRTHLSSFPSSTKEISDQNPHHSHDSRGNPTQGTGSGGESIADSPTHSWNEVDESSRLVEASQQSSISETANVEKTESRRTKEKRKKKKNRESLEPQTSTTCETHEDSSLPTGGLDPSSRTSESARGCCQCAACVRTFPQPCTCGQVHHSESFQPQHMHAGGSAPPSTHPVCPHYAPPRLYPPPVCGYPPVPFAVFAPPPPPPMLYAPQMMMPMAPASGGASIVGMEGAISAVSPYMQYMPPVLSRCELCRGRGVGLAEKNGLCAHCNRLRLDFIVASAQIRRRCTSCGGWGLGLVQPNGLCRHCTWLKDAPSPTMKTQAAAPIDWDASSSDSDSDWDD